MSYYFCIVGTRDNPIYEADLAARSTASLGPSSFFSNSNGSSASGVGGTSHGSSSSSSSNLGGASSSAGSGALSGVGNLLRGSSPAPSSSHDSSTRASSSDLSRNTSTDASSRVTSVAPTETGSSASGSGSVFGFGTALGALAGGFTGLAGSSGLTVGSAGNLQAGTKGPLGGAAGRGLGFGRYNDKDVLQMIAHSSLDAVEDVQFFNGAMYMKSVDRINEWTTSAFLIPGNVKFLILHEHKHDDGIRNFFLDVWELWVKITMNPFRTLNAPIQSSAFDQKVRASAKRYL